MDVDILIVLIFAEWASRFPGEVNRTRCPLCHKTKQDGHVLDCEFASVLKALREKVKGK